MAGKKKRPQTRQPAPMSLIACERYQAFADQGFVDIAHGLCRQLLPHKTICKNTNKNPKNMFFSSFSSNKPYTIYTKHNGNQNDISSSLSAVPVLFSSRPNCRFLFVPQKIRIN
jgi:hypothetical protein